MLKISLEVNLIIKKFQTQKLKTVQNILNRSQCKKLRIKLKKLRIIKSIIKVQYKGKTIILKRTNIIFPFPI